MRIRLCTELPVPPARVWSAIEDVRTHTAWMTDAAEITVVGDRTFGVGTRLRCLTVVGPLRTTDVMTVTEWVPPAVMGIEHVGAVTGRGRFTLEEAGTGTRFCWDEELHLPWWLGGRAGEVIARPVLTRVWRGNLERLQRYVAAVTAR